MLGRIESGVHLQGILAEERRKLAVQVQVLLNMPSNKIEYDGM